MTRTPAKPSALALIASVYNNRGDRALPAVLQHADAALDRALSQSEGQSEGLLDVITQAAEDLNRVARLDTYGPQLADYEAAVMDPALVDQAGLLCALEAAGRLRGDDTEAAFAIGLAAGLRLGGAR